MLQQSGPVPHDCDHDKGHWDEIHDEMPRYAPAYRSFPTPPGRSVTEQGAQSNRIIEVVSGNSQSNVFAHMRALNIERVADQFRGNEVEHTGDGGEEEAIAHEMKDLHAHHHLTRDTCVRKEQCSHEANQFRNRAGHERRIPAAEIGNDPVGLSAKPHQELYGVLNEMTDLKGEPESDGYRQ